jgi:hypothetical protein
LDEALLNRPKNDFLFKKYYAFGLGKVSQLSGDYAKATAHFQALLRHALHEGDSRMALDIYSELAIVESTFGNWQIAEDYLLKGEEIVDQDYFAGSELLYQAFCSLYRARGDRNKLLKYQSKYIATYEKVNNLSASLKFRRAEQEHYNKEHALRLQAQDEALQLKEQVIGVHRIVMMGIALICVLLGILTFVLVTANKKKISDNVLLEQKVKERSKELEARLQELRFEIQEDRIHSSHTMSPLKHHLGAICSLSALALKDRTDLREYFARIRII